jgi:hypothetical protein
VRESTTPWVFRRSWRFWWPRVAFVVVSLGALWWAAAHPADPPEPGRRDPAYTPDPAPLLTAEAARATAYAATVAANYGAHGPPGALDDGGRPIFTPETVPDDRADDAAAQEDLDYLADVGYPDCGEAVTLPSGRDIERADC